jgi:hypothetical protein
MYSLVFGSGKFAACIPPATVISAIGTSTRLAISHIRMSASPRGRLRYAKSWNAGIQAFAESHRFRPMVSS